MSPALTSTSADVFFQRSILEVIRIVTRPTAGDRALPFGWMIELWLGAILATLVAGWLYKD